MPFAVRNLLMLNQNTAAQYASSVLATSPLTYWKLKEGGGSVIVDSSGNAYNGIYTGVTWDATRSPVSEPVPYFDGANDFGNVHSAGFAGALDMDEFCILIWFKAPDEAFWTDGTSYRILRFLRDANNRIDIVKFTGANQVLFQRLGNGTAKTVSVTDASLFTGTEWMSFIISATVAGDEQKFYHNGVQIGATATGLAASTGTGLDATATLLGATSTIPTNPLDGYLSQCAVWASPVDSAKLALGTV